MWDLFMCRRGKTGFYKGYICVHVGCKDKGGTWLGQEAQTKVWVDRVNRETKGTGATSSLGGTGAFRRSSLGSLPSEKMQYPIGYTS